MNNFLVNILNLAYLVSYIFVKFLITTAISLSLSPASGWILPNLAWGLAY
jgi:hypothetical protein